MNPFSSRVLVVLVVVGVGTFLFGLVFSAFGEETFPEPHAGHSPDSNSLVGHQALCELLEETGVDVVVAESPAAWLTDSDTALLLIEPFARDGRQRKSLEDRSDWMSRFDRARRSGPVLIVLSKWSATQDKDKPEWIGSRAPLLDEEINELVAPLLAKFSSYPFTFARPSSADNWSAGGLGAEDWQVELPEPQLLRRDGDLEPVVETEEGILIARTKGDVYVLSDPDFISNERLGQGDNAALFHRLLTRRFGVASVVVDESTHRYDANPSLMNRVLSFPQNLIVIHVLVLLALWAWSVGRRFGKVWPAPPEIAAGKELLIDNTANLLDSVGGVREGLRRYLEESMIWVARSCALPVDDSETGLCRRLNRLTRARGIAVDLEELRVLAYGDELKKDAALRLASDIHAWRTSMVQTET